MKKQVVSIRARQKTIERFRHAARKELLKHDEMLTKLLDLYSVNVNEKDKKKHFFSV